MGAGYSVVNGNEEISREFMQKMYAKYSDPSAYNAWKTQLEYATKQQDQYYKTMGNYSVNISVQNHKCVYKHECK